MWALAPGIGACLARPIGRRGANRSLTRKLVYI